MYYIIYCENNISGFTETEEKAQDMVDSLEDIGYTAFYTSEEIFRNG